jgi:arabinogalactan endo-1,4-beta-galactosidase
MLNLNATLKAPRPNSMKNPFHNLSLLFAATALASCVTSGNQPPPAPKSVADMKATNSAGGSSVVFNKLPQGYILGADISSVQQAEDRGTIYSDKGQPMDILQIFKSHGFNYIRLRIFVDPTKGDAGTPRAYSPEGYCDLPHTIKFAQRVKAAGLNFLLDFHYADDWADPGHQWKPSAWQGLTFPELVQAVHDYTKDALTQLKAAGAEPDMVQIGNEITPGMIWPDGRLGNGGGGWDNLAALLKAGIAATREVDPKILVMLHIDKGQDNRATVSWVDNALQRGVEFDILGESCYTTWQGPPQTIQANFEALAKKYPNLAFINDEYGGGRLDASRNLLGGQSGRGSAGSTVVQANPYPGQYKDADWTMRAANDVMFNLPDHRGLGTFIWEPTQNGNMQTLFTRNIANTNMYLFDQMAKDYAK